MIWTAVYNPLCRCRIQYIGTKKRRINLAEPAIICDLIAEVDNWQLYKYNFHIYIYMVV